MSTKDGKRLISLSRNFYIFSFNRNLAENYEAGYKVQECLPPQKSPILSQAEQLRGQQLK